MKVTLIVILALTLILLACGEVQAEPEPRRFIVTYARSLEQRSFKIVRILRDTETGVDYLMVWGDMGGAMTPLLSGER